MDGAPSCGRCTYELATRQQRATSLGLTIAGLGGSGAFWAYRAGKLTPLLAGLAGAAAAIVALIVAILVRSGKKGEIEKRDRDQELEDAQQLRQEPAHPYRQRARQATINLAPKVSGSGTALVLVVSFALAGVLFPAGLQMSRWVEIELALAASWVAMTAVLGHLLYRGYRLRDDYIFVSPGRLFSSSKSSSGSWDPGCDCSPGCSSLDGEGVIAIIALVLAAIVLAGATWVLVEIALPVVVFVVYSLVLAALRHVAHDRHGCEGDVVKSIGWGAMWSALFIAPLGIVVGVVQYALSAR